MYIYFSTARKLYLSGTVIGPLLYLIMISDLGSDVSKKEAKMLKYVDDSKTMKKVEEEEDVHEFQQVIGKLTKWQRDNNMKFNQDKFLALRIETLLPAPIYILTPTIRFFYTNTNNQILYTNTNNQILFSNTNN